MQEIEATYTMRVPDDMKDIHVKELLLDIGNPLGMEVKKWKKNKWSRKRLVKEGKIHDPNISSPNRRNMVKYLRGEIKLDIPEDRDSDGRVGRNLKF